MSDIVRVLAQGQELLGSRTKCGRERDVEANIRGKERDEVAVASGTQEVARG